MKKNPLIPVSIVTAVLVVYTFLAISEIALGLVYIIFLFSPLLIGWMVIMILKSDSKSDRTFDEYFYDDVDIKRSGKESGD